MGTRTYVPFDVFAMQVDVPVSTMVRDGDFGWTCGQCPLDRSGNVISPGDLVAQVGYVCEMIKTVLRRGGLDTQSVGKLNVYFCALKPGERELAYETLIRHFAHGPVIVLIPVPHFYYEGMLVEVDVFTGTHAKPRKLPGGQGIDLQIVDGGDMVWASARAALANDATLEERLAEILAALEQQGLTPDMLLSDHWFLSEHGEAEPIGAIIESELVTNPNALVRFCPQSTDSIIGELTFCRNAVETKTETANGGKLSLYQRRGGAALWVSGTYAGPGMGLVDQTRHIMSGIERSLASENMTFGNVTKLTAHYVGGANPEELHNNMAIRHSYYSSPGPASTGLPVMALQNPQCKIAIDLVALA